jgi:hypothetical protein
VPACPRRHLGRPGRGRLHLRLRRTRRIGDFTRWKEDDAYSQALERLLRDLKVAASPGVYLQGRLCPKWSTGWLGQANASGPQEKFLLPDQRFVA